MFGSIQREEIETAIFGDVVQMVRMPACHAGGHGFDPRHHRQLSQ